MFYYMDSTVEPRYTIQIYFVIVIVTYGLAYKI